MKAPREGATKVSDMVFGEVVTQNKELDDMVLLKRDGLPTYNFANVVDDHLMGITHVLRGSEYISSAPKYNLLYEAFGWEIPRYITVSLIMRDEHHKLSKRHGDPTYDDLLKQGYLPEAVLNYIALLGWSPGGEREIFTLSELCGIFDIGGISKSPAIFDIDKLNHFNSEYIRALAPGRFAEIAERYIRSAVKNEKYPAGAIASILQARCGKLDDIPSMIGFFDELPEYGTELFVHKKSKTDEAISLDMLRAALAELDTMPEWTHESIHDTLVALGEKLGVKNATLMWPVRIAISGQAVTPGGAVELAWILGRDEVIRRISAGIGKLSAACSE
jgi:glutamyl-tRNA synthetase